MNRLSFRGGVPKNRQDRLIEILRYIENASIVELYWIVEEIRCVRGCLFSWDEDSRQYKKAESTCLNGDTIQLNLEKWEQNK